MPRKYERKRERKYSLEDLQRAVKDVEDKKKTYREAEDFYNVPISVIYHRIKGRKIDINKMGAGASKVLSDRVEGHLVSCINIRAQMGHPVLKEELKLIVKEYVENNNMKTPFKENKPGDDWYVNFMSRYPKLSLKKPEHLQQSRIDARKPHVIYDFYDLLNNVVKSNGLGDKPMFIYNCDESGFQSDPSKMRAIGQKGKPLYRVSGGSGRESTTVLACVSADGQTLPPLIVFKGAAVQARWTSEKSFPGTFYAATKNGWMEEAVFFNWLTKSFICHINALRQKRNEPNQKALLIYDGHASHISVRIVEEAQKSNIELLKFPSHLTDRIQPLDKCVFGPIKKAWDRKLIEYGVKQMGKGSGRLTKTRFSELLGEVYVTALKPQNIISGFTTTGIFPVDPSKFPKNLFSTEDLKLYEALLNYDQDEGKQLTPEIDDEQLDMERYHRENKQINAQQTNTGNGQIQIPQIDREIDKIRNEKHTQKETETEPIDIQHEAIVERDTQMEQFPAKKSHEQTEIHNRYAEKRQLKPNTYTQNQKIRKMDDQIKTPKINKDYEHIDARYKKIDIQEIEIEQINTQNKVMNTQEAKKEQVNTQNIEIDTREEIVTEQVDMQNKEICSQEVIETEQVEMQNDENIYIQEEIEIEQVNTQNIEIDTREETVTEQVDMQNKEICSQEVIETEQVVMQNDENIYIQEEIEIEQVYMQNEDIDTQLEVEIEQVNIQNEDTHEEIEHEQVKVQNKETIVIDKQEYKETEHVNMKKEEMDTKKKQRSQKDKNRHAEVAAAHKEKNTEKINVLHKHNDKIDKCLEKQGEKQDTYIEHSIIEKLQKRTEKKDTVREPANTCLINNIMKLISLDTNTSSEIKDKIIGALVLSLDNQKSNNEVLEQSPNKDALKKLFGVCATPQKANKIVVPRLKQSAFGEILTSEEVKDRLRLAEEKKIKTKKNNIGKLTNITNTEKVKKGKGKGKKKTKAETKKETKKINKIKTKKQKPRTESEDSESDVVMSTHSDSDIADVLSDGDVNDYGEICVQEKDKQRNITPALTCTSPIAGSSKSKEIEQDIIEYNVDDNILVRYIFKKKVEYFVGKIIEKTDDNYMVSFYKRVGKNDNIKFIVSKKDVDYVLPNMVVKSVNLLVLNERETEYIFMDDEDSVYFD